MNSCKLLLVLLLCCSLHLHARTHSVADSTEVLGEVDSAHPIQIYAPLLKYVFFEKGSAEIPKRYLMFTSPQEANKFTLDSVHGNAIMCYYHILNIIGYRLRNNLTSKLTIVGCNDNNTMRTSPEELREGLSKQRATVVYNYLKDIWQIPETQLKLLYRNLPERPSNPKDSLGVLENRRVELQCDDWEISKPINQKGYWFKNDIENEKSYDVLRIELIDVNWMRKNIGKNNERALMEYVIPKILSGDTIDLFSNDIDYLEGNQKATNYSQVYTIDLMKKKLQSTRKNVTFIAFTGADYPIYETIFNHPENLMFNRYMSITIKRKK
ncbi:MAG: hypothetical protein JNJ85_00110 [Candidatus Kapabacteria bacterium]|nr:hypothetical protein [Candidatus Kapabacteria bacterium]